MVAELSILPAHVSGRTLSRSNATADAPARPEQASAKPSLITDKVELTSASDEPADINENPEVQRYSREKNQAREAFERLVKEFKMVRKVWANDPEELAVQLVRLGKELAKVVKQYQKAQAALAEVLGKMTGPALNMPALGSSASVPAKDTTETAPSELSGGAEPVEPAAPQDAESPDVQQPLSAEGLAAYQKMTGKRIRLDDTPFAHELRGDIEFAHGFREFATKLRHELEYGIKRAPNMPGHSKEREEFMEDAHGFLEDLESELFKYEGALKRAMPPAIYVTVQA